LEHGSPLVGNWEEAEMWNYEVKEPVHNLDNYLYAIDCEIGDMAAVPAHTTYTNTYQCVFDTNTSYSSAFASSLSGVGGSAYEPTYSSTSEDMSVTKTYDSMGLSFTGAQYTDDWCLGGSDVHITVCLPNQRFVYVTKENFPSNNKNKAQWKPPLASFNDVTAIIGLGTQPLADSDSWNFINSAFEQGYIAADMYTFQGVYDDPEYAHVTIGGYNYQDMAGDIEWYNMTYTEGWRVNITNMTIDGDINLMTAPTPETEHYLGAGDVDEITSYGHFNSGYPFIGVDQNVGDMVETDLQFFRPDISCKYDATWNPWNICYYSEACKTSDMPGNLTFAFGTSATFNLPVSDLMIDYTVSSQELCGIGI
jgi:hypothetical protein